MDGPSVLQSAKHLGERLRAARNTAGFSARVAARRLQQLGFRVSHATICNYERGKTLPSVGLVKALGTIYQRSFEWLIGRGTLLTAVRYRCLKSVKVSEKKQFESDALGWLQAYLFVEKLLGRQHAQRPLRANSGESGSDLAHRIRARYSLGIYPIPSVIRLAENFGIRVIQLATDARIDGCAAHLGDVPVVVLNSALPNDRIRLNAAHELAHHLYQDCRGPNTLTPDEIERRAFECASHLLIPEDQLAKAFELKSMVRLVQYKERFGISLAAMIYRARQSNLIPKRMYERLWRDFGRLGWRKEEPGYVPPDRPVRMEALIDGGVRENKTSYPEIAQIAGVDEAVVVQRIFHAMGGVLDTEDEVDESRTLTLRSYTRDRNV